MEENDNIRNLPGGTGKKNPFSVPEGYFDSFPARMAERLQDEEPLPAATRPGIWQTIRPQLALAATITAFAVIGYLGFRSFMVTDDQWLSDEMITGYIEYYQYEFSEPYLLGLLAEDDYYLDDYPEDGGWAEADDPDLYIDYLYQEEIDLYLIMTEF
ncbi:MAG: hypothetical protein EA408_02170 [Marinilabiliales bacterium]|nr:MAG: hypothetical protein EA408_02170 [Marinilabiliales bacterium]